MNGISAGILSVYEELADYRRSVADLGREVGRMVIVFNYAYNPACAYNPRWVCPLPPSPSGLPCKALSP
jgi:uncharacterized protein (DUF1684 family)